MCLSEALKIQESCKNVKQLRHSQNTFSGQSFVPVAFLQKASSLNARWQHSMSNLVFEKGPDCVIDLSSERSVAVA